jgi:hypothetical protein
MRIHETFLQNKDPSRVCSGFVTLSANHCPTALSLLFCVTEHAFSPTDQAEIFGHW